MGTGEGRGRHLDAPARLAVSGWSNCAHDGSQDSQHQYVMGYTMGFVHRNIDLAGLLALFKEMSHDFDIHKVVIRMI